MTDSKITPTEARSSACASGKDGHHSCKDCPICGTEQCRMMQELGMFCATQVAATEAVREKRRRHKKPAPPVTARPRVHAAAGR